MERVNTVWTAPITALYARVDLTRKNSVSFDYQDGHGSFIRSREGQAGKAGQQVINRWGTRRPAQTLWGRSAHMRFAVGRSPERRHRNMFDYIAPEELEPGRSAPVSHPQWILFSLSSPE